MYFVLDKKYNMCSGISHQKSNLQSFILLAKTLGYTAILPKLYLSATHNFGKEKISNLTEYLDISGNDILEKLPDNIDKKLIYYYLPKTKLIRKDKFFLSQKIVKQDFTLKYKDIYYDLAKKILSKLTKPIACVHVRRGDRLSSYKNLNIKTRSDNIIKKLKSLNKPIATVYIMTNETKPNFFKKIRDHYNLVLYSDFEELIKLKKEDNYKLFITENCIMELSDIKISTFNTQKTRKKVYNTQLNNDNEGWQ
jgi:hypothetical protein